MPDRIAIYTRVSTDSQATEGLSLETQLQNCGLYAQSQGHTPPFCLYMDAGLSGGSMDRRLAMLQLLEDVEARRIQRVIVSKLDRAWRSVRDAADSLERIRKSGGSLALLDLQIDTSSNAGEMMFSVLSAFAQFERRRIGERVHQVNARIVLGGRHIGTAPLGYLRGPDKQLIPDPETADLVKRIFAAYVADDTTGPGKIARDLTREGYKTRTGAWYDRTAIQAILRNTAYVAQLRYGHSSTPKHRRWIDDTERIRAQGSHEPLIDAETWARVQAKLKRRQTAGRNTSPARLYGGLVWCSYCQARLYSTRGGEPARLYYACGTTRKATARECPEARSISVDILDELVTPALVANLKRIQAKGGVARRAAAKPRSKERERSWIAGKMSRLQEVYIAGDLTREEWQARRAALQADLDALETPIIQKAPPLPQEALLQAIQALPDPTVAIEDRRAVADLFIARIVVTKDALTIHYRDLEYLGWRTEETIRRPLPWERGRGPRGPYKGREKQ